MDILSPPARASQFNREGVASARPSASQALKGVLWHSTDTGEVSRCDGTQWLTIVPPSGTYALPSLDSLPLSDEIKTGKLGKLGTGGRGVVALRFDHQLDPFIAEILPLLNARGLPGSMGVVTRSVGNLSAAYEPTAATWSDIYTKLLATGIEVWAHSRTHGDGGGDYAGEIVGSKADIEANLPNCRVMGWQQPGSPCTYGTPHNSAVALDDTAGKLIRQTYGLYESSLWSSRRMIPTNGCRGLNHQTVDSETLATVKGWIDMAANRGVGLELMLHSRVLDEAGMMTTADYTAVLDYIVALRDAGKIEVMTASGLAFADPGSNHRPSLIPYGDFEGQVTGTIPVPWTNSGAAWTIGTDGGHSGSNYLRIPAGQGVAVVSAPCFTDGIDGHAFEFEGWFRSTTYSANWRLKFSADLTGTPFYVVRDVSSAAPIPQSTGWTHVRIPIVIPKGTHDFYVALGRTGTTNTADWDDVSLVAI